MQSNWLVLMLPWSSLNSWSNKTSIPKVQEEHTGFTKFTMISIIVMITSLVINTSWLKPDFWKHWNCLWMGMFMYHPKCISAIIYACWAHTSTHDVIKYFSQLYGFKSVALLYLIMKWTLEIWAFMFWSYLLTFSQKFLFPKVNSEWNIHNVVSIRMNAISTLGNKDVPSVQRLENKDCCYVLNIRI